jgi:DNA repair ATPase RecN
MAEDITTQELTDSEMLRLILNELTEQRKWRASMDEWRASVDEWRARVDERLKDTRPIWQTIHAQTERNTEWLHSIDERLGNVEATTRRLDNGLTQLSRELLGIKARQHELESITFASRNP